MPKINGIKIKFHNFRFGIGLFNLDRCNHFLGSSIDLKVTKNIFDSLSITYKVKSKDLICTIPSFRNDLNREVDLYEEIVRVFGYNNIDNSSSCAITF